MNWLYLRLLCNEFLGSNGSFVPCSISLCNFDHLSHDMPAQQIQEIARNVPDPSTCGGGVRERVNIACELFGLGTFDRYFTQHQVKLQKRE